MKFFSLFLILGCHLYMNFIVVESIQQLGCHYEFCPKTDPKKINVHLIPFIQNHIGYNETVEIFYEKYGKNQINSIIDSLLKNPKRRFTYLDTIILWKWWLDESNEGKKETLKNLVNEGRFELANGGVTVIDEAVTHYQSIIDQYTLGLKRLKDMFGNCGRPKTGFLVGSFGHTSEHAIILEQMGFDGTFLNSFLKENEKNFVWNTDENSDKIGEIFTTILDKNQFSKTYCYNVNCLERTHVIDNRSDINYVKSKATKLIHTIKYVVKKEEKTNDTIFLIGGSSYHTVAESLYSNFDKIIKYINGSRYYAKNINFFYSTPSCYLNSLNKQNIEWQKKKYEKFFPFRVDQRSYYTGYYSSRPAFKYIVKQSNNFLQIVKQLSVLSGQSDNEELNSFRETVALAQSMNMVTGIHTEEASLNHTKNLLENMENATQIASKALNKLMAKKEISETPKFYTCMSLNVSDCKHTTENKKFIVTIYNPNSQLLSTYVRLPLQKGTYEVKNPEGTNVVTQMIPIPEQVLKIPGRESEATMELIFLAVNVPPLGYRSYYVQQQSSEAEAIQPYSGKSIGTEEGYNVAINSKKRIFVTSKKDAKGIELQQSFYYYESSRHHNGRSNVSFHTVPSGVIIFQPKNLNVTEIIGSENYQIFKGPLVEEIHFAINDYVSQIVRIYNSSNHIEFEWLVGPIPPDSDGIGKEIITRYSSNVKNSRKEWYTDENGRKMIKRRMVAYYTKQYCIYNKPLNYYPVNTKISIINYYKKNQMMSVLVDRPEGGASLSIGEIELMLHRRPMSSDRASVKINLNDSSIVRGKHYLLINNLKNSRKDFDDVTMEEKQLEIQINNRPWLFFTPITETFEEWQEKYKMKSNDTINDLPKNVRILTLEPWKNETILLRLEHMIGKLNSNLYSKPVQFNLKDLFEDIKIVSAREMTLGADQELKDNNKLVWKTAPFIVRKPNQSKTTKKQQKEEINETIENQTVETTSTATNTNSKIENSLLNVTLEPMEIKTFILEIVPKSAN